VVSAILGLGLLLLIAFYVFIEFFLNPTMLRSDRHYEGKSTASWESDSTFLRILPHSPPIPYSFSSTSVLS